MEKTMKEKNQLHALLAVVTDLKTKARLIATEGITTFVKKAEHFDGVQKAFESLEADRMATPAETKVLVTTVPEKLAYVQGALSKGIDATLSMEETNSSGNAKAELSVNGTPFGTFSATSLLAMEKWLDSVLELYKSIPTLDPTKAWTKDATAGRKGEYKSAEETKYHTAKKHKPIVLYDA
jgi:hypothetical protein